MDIVKAQSSNPPKPNRVTVADLRPGKRVRSVFLVLSKRKDVTRAGAPYLSLSLGDRTGSLQARVWDQAERFDPLFELGDYLFVDGLAETYRGELQLRVQHLERVADSAVDESEFIAASAFDAAEMLDRLRALLADVIEDADLARILDAFLGDPEVEWGLLRSPAAKANHHAYLAGLLEHTLSMCEIAAAVGKHYERQYGPLLRTELLVAGALLHDIGKLWELSGGRVIAYTDVGNLIGHITLGVERLSRVVEALGVDNDELVLRLKHMILSHHGQPEYGAVVEPKTPEAQVLHYIDQIDSRMNMFARALQGIEGGWSRWVSPLRRSLYAGPTSGAEVPAKADERGAEPTTAADSASAPPVAPASKAEAAAGPSKRPAWAEYEAELNASLTADGPPHPPVGNGSSEEATQSGDAVTVQVERASSETTAPDATAEDAPDFGLTPSEPEAAPHLLPSQPVPDEAADEAPPIDSFTLDLFNA